MEALQSLENGMVLKEKEVKGHSWVRKRARAPKRMIDGALMLERVLVVNPRQVYQV